MLRPDRPAVFLVLSRFCQGSIPIAALRRCAPQINYSRISSRGCSPEDQGCARFGVPIPHLLNACSVSSVRLAFYR
ncbi:hypothetical protein GGS23DRAFT_496961 [Durotheca rogersii]|uniref:uncharacterized protein n=1 Tax=Durotheca rogersii TaxID=419775 RepID=UPI002220B8D1|nr:uncharacterized protein GGS23DRAFT_496961 [Durotheca rogersii]KAI5864380.1 hypothetical protein GGS23DRAFT_496961 [Durotheca rogersii]